MTANVQQPDKVTTIRDYSDIRGWFPWLDYRCFNAVLAAQSDLGGDLVELGAYLGKSAVVIGDHLRDGEQFVVVDLFGADELIGSASSDDANRTEVSTSYSTLTREEFERNYASLHDGRLPTVVQGLSSSVTEHAAPNSARFVHIDASHMYDQVRVDIQNTRSILRPGGMVVFDDFRSAHTPGVAAAVWDAVLHGGLIPVAITEQKMYATYDDPARYRDSLQSMVDGDARLHAATSGVAGHEFLRITIAKSHQQAQRDERERKSDLARAAERNEAIRRAVDEALRSGRRHAVPTAQLSAPRRALRRIARDHTPRPLAKWVVRTRDRVLFKPVR